MSKGRSWLRILPRLLHFGVVSLKYLTTTNKPKTNNNSFSSFKKPTIRFFLWHTERHICVRKRISRLSHALAQVAISLRHWSHFDPTYPTTKNDWFVESTTLVKIKNKIVLWDFENSSAFHNVCDDVLTNVANVMSKYHTGYVGKLSHNLLEKNISWNLQKQNQSVFYFEIEIESNVSRFAFVFIACSRTSSLLKIQKIEKIKVKEQREYTTSSIFRTRQATPLIDIVNIPIFISR